MAVTTGALRELDGFVPGQRGVFLRANHAIRIDPFASYAVTVSVLRQWSTEFLIKNSRPGLVEITGDVQEWVRATGVERGVLTLFIRHTSASLIIQENADPEVAADLRRFMERLVPEGDRLFVHTAEGADDMPAHVRSALTATSLSIPIRSGEPALGRWQGIYVWEHRRSPHRREVVAQLIGE